MIAHHSQTRSAHAKQPAIASELKLPLALRAAAWLAVFSITAASAIVLKELNVRTPAPTARVALAATSSAPADADAAADLPALPSTIAPSAGDPVQPASPQPPAPQPLPAPALVWQFDLPAGAVADTGIRYFNGRPVRPARTIFMLVTAYSPDARSCGDSADGITASLHSVETNGHALVAADRRVLPMGSMLTIPGYDQGDIVPVLDVGGKIKGNRLDVLFPTHAAARAWGVRRLPVVVWEYADGLPSADWRRIRDGR